MKPPRYLIQQYETFFFDIELERFLGTNRSSLTETPVTQLAENPNAGLNVFRCRLGWHIRASAKMHSLLANRVQPADWETICGKPSGLAQLFNLCGLDPEDCHTITTTRPKTRKEFDYLCRHNLQFACDAETFHPQAPIEADIIRISLGHPFWPKDSQTGCGIGYVALSEGKDIAMSKASHRPGMFHDALWAMVVGVRREHWRKGLGRAVAALSTQEVVQMGHIALWSTEANNIASVRIAESLGYQRTFCHIKVPQSVLGEAR